MSDLEHHTWITLRRQKILGELLALRKLGAKAESWGSASESDLRDAAYGWNRLVGAAFALWRALPLILAEQTCCSFLNFTLRFDGSTVVMTLTAPDRAQQIVSDLTGRTGTGEAL